MPRAPIMIGLPLHVVIMPSPFWTVTLYFVMIEIGLVSEVLPTLMSECKQLANVLTLMSSFGSCGTGSVIAFVSVLTSPFITPTLLVEWRSIGSYTFFSIVLADVFTICSQILCDRDGLVCHVENAHLCLGCEPHSWPCVKQLLEGSRGLIAQRV